jgi:hypothetical protein
MAEHLRVQQMREEQQKIGLQSAERWIPEQDIAELRRAKQLWVEQHRVEEQRAEQTNVCKMILGIALVRVDGSVDTPDAPILTLEMWQHIL